MGDLLTTPLLACTDKTYSVIFGGHVYIIFIFIHHTVVETTVT